MCGQRRATGARACRTNNVEEEPDVHLADAQLRHRELTQEIYDIGDDIATHIDNLIQALQDWDEELLGDCLEEFRDIVQEGRADARRGLAELAALRAALIGGLHAGTLSAPAQPARARVEEPELLTAQALTAAYPLGGAPIDVRELIEAMNGRAELITGYLEEIVEFVLDRTAMAAIDVDSVNLPLIYRRAAEMVEAACECWRSAIAREQPAYVRALRGSHPPQFLSERARVDMVVARVVARMKMRSSSSGA